jgi:hypothetical protein
MNSSKIIVFNRLIKKIKIIKFIMIIILMETIYNLKNKMIKAKMPKKTFGMLKKKKNLNSID